jgi:hypothetical protein
MTYNCEFCLKTFSSKSSLSKHLSNAKYCIKNRDIETEINTFDCIDCQKKFTSNQSLKLHQLKCIEKIKKLHQENILDIKEKYESEIKNYKSQIQELQNKLENIIIKTINLKKDDTEENYYDYVIDTDNIEILQKENKDKDIRISYLTNKYVKKTSRIQIEEANVIYILTTARLKKDNIYILGKATNLTSRLSTYNKSDEHEIIYYQQCKNKESMGIIENMVFNKLDIFREKANRERFVLPKGEDIELFKNTIKECIDFFK